MYQERWLYQCVGGVASCATDRGRFKRGRSELKLWKKGSMNEGFGWIGLGSR